MLNLYYFTTYALNGESGLQYDGAKNNYYITRKDVGFQLTVEHADGTSESYGCSTLSTAIASIEALENGEEI